MRLPPFCLAFVVLSAALRIFAEGPEPPPAPDTTATPASPAAAQSEPPTPPPAPADQPIVTPPAALPVVDDEPTTVKLADASLDAVLQLLQSWTGLSILRPQNLPIDTYTLVLDKPIPKSEAVRALETLLVLHGIGVVPLDDHFLKVVPASQASREAPEMITGSTLDLPPSGRIVAKLFQLQFLRVNEIIPPLQQIMSQSLATPPVLFENANAALIVDTVANLQRIEVLLKKVDQPLAANLSPRFYQVRYAQASDLVNKIHAIFQGPLQAQIGSSTIYSADDRTNQIILISDPRQYPLFDSLIAKLDINAASNTRNEVIYLKHAASKDVANLLGTLISNETSAAQKSGQNGTRPAGEQPPAPGQPPSLTTLGVKGEATGFSNYVTVVSDDRSNAIVVSGTSDDIRLIQEVVDKIDVLLAQVSIQVIIAEVTLNDTDTSGISALKLTVGTDAIRGTHITGFDTSSSNGTGMAGWDVTAGTVNPLAFTALMNNTGNKSNVKILSADTVTTTHAKEADFKVTEEQPIITGTTSVPLSSTGTTTTANNGFSTSSQVNYKDIGIEVKVTPLIGNDGSIQMQIDQTVDDVVSNVTIDGNTQPIIGHREATSNVTVQDGQMVVLGGLQQSKLSNSRTKLGFLYEIPILSNLLGNRNHETDRTELLFFVRPHIIPVAGGTADANKRIDEMSNKDQVHQFLQDPTKPPKETILDRYYK